MATNLSHKICLNEIVIKLQHSGCMFVVEKHINQHLEEKILVCGLCSLLMSAMENTRTALNQPVTDYTCLYYIWLPCFTEISCKQ